MAASASAPGGEPQKQLLSIIRDFAAEKSHGERTVSGLKRRLDDVVAASDAATAELEAAKRAREAAETELRGSQVQSSIAAATIQALEATISHLQEEIAKVGSELEDLKSKEDSERDEFISQMLEMNARIRQFQQMASAELAGKSSELSEDGMQGKATNSDQGKATDGHNLSDKNETAESEGMLTDLADKVSNVEAEMHALEEEYQKDLLEHKKVLIHSSPQIVLLLKHVMNVILDTLLWFSPDYNCSTRESMLKNSCRKTTTYLRQAYEYYLHLSFHR
uniref:Uncharacterized protein n=1 Tax=Avena sativa TaxID=4498 RepID=A0ACD5ZV30_AVESA